MLFPKFNYGQEQIRCTVIYRDSVTEVQPYQLVFDTVKMIYSGNWNRIDYIVNEPDTKLYFPKIIIENDSIRYFSYQNIDSQLYYENIDKSLPNGKGVNSINVTSTIEEKDILGYKCAKYIVQSNLTNGYTTTKFYWVTQGFSLGNHDPLLKEGIEGYPLQIETVYETKDGIYKYTDVLYAIEVNFNKINPDIFSIKTKQKLIPYSTEQFRGEFNTK